MTLGLKHKKRINLLIFLLLVLGGTAQVPVQVITKTIEKSFTYRDGYEVNIEGDKAEVWIETWEKNEIHLVLEIIAKHPEKEVAEADLKKMKYFTQKVSKRIYLRNFVSTDDDVEKPASLLKVKYTIKLPERCPVYLKNNFGQANVSNLQNRLRVNSEFSQLALFNLKGIIDLKTRFGDVQGKMIEGDVDIVSRRSDILLENIKGRFSIQAEYGSIRLFSASELIELNIDAKQSDVYFNTPNLESFAYNLSAQHGNIFLPDNLKFKESENTIGLKKASYRPEEEYFANITIAITFGNLTLSK